MATLRSFSSGQKCFIFSRLRERLKSSVDSCSWMGHMPVFTRSSVVCETEPDRELLNGSAQRATMNNRPELFVAKVKGWPWWPAKVSC